VGQRPAGAGRPRFDIGDIVRQHRGALEAETVLTVGQRRALSAIALCRTEALGGHIDRCTSCGHEHPAYNSCRNRHCPKCQALAQEAWIAARSERVLPVRHFHVVLTLPSELRSVAKQRRRVMYDALMAAASATLVELGRSRLGVRLGITLVLHTWTRDLRFHPHVHAIVTAGGMGVDGAPWRPSRPDYLLPVAVIGALFRGKMIAALRAMHRDGCFDRIEALSAPDSFERLVASLAVLRWVVYAKKPFRRVGHVLAYLGRYTHRVAIANSRIVDVTDDAVTFRTKDGQTVTLPPVVFLRRFVQHILPHAFHKIRHYGLYSSAAAKAGGPLDAARQQLAPCDDEASEHRGSVVVTLPLIEALCVLTGRDIARCPRCGGLIERVLVAKQRPPPLPLRMAA
jgi:hypothetical protein